MKILRFFQKLVLPNKKKIQFAQKLICRQDQRVRICWREPEKPAGRDASGDFLNSIQIWSPLPDQHFDCEDFRMTIFNIADLDINIWLWGSQDDRKIFNFDIADLEWAKFLDNWTTGCRQFVFKVESTNYIIIFSLIYRESIGKIK